jgi:ketosteroid isomerase-like protein
MGVIKPVAGTGDIGSAGDDGPATQAQLNLPVGLASTPDGGFLIADLGNRVVRRVSPNGVITRVAGTIGVAGTGGLDGPATQAQLDSPNDIAPLDDGGFLIADGGNLAVYRVSEDGVITCVAGTIGVAGSGGDDGPATLAQLAGASAVAVTADGGFLIADTGNQVIRKVSADGVITRMAGTTGVTGSIGDDGPALDAQLNRPTALAMTADGGFLITDTDNQVVRKVSAGGVITRVAGTTTPSGTDGDDGPATDATLTLPFGVAATADGGFLIVDEQRVVVRKVSAGGVITRVAGQYGKRGSDGDDGPATEATLGGPIGVATTADGGFLIADTDTNRIRKVFL